MPNIESGIGAGVALLCARQGASVAVIGRNTALGASLTNSLTLESKEKGVKHEFICGDLSTAAGVKAAAGKVAEWVGANHVDYLFQTQGGPPPAESSRTVDGLDSYYAIQVFSRFVLPYTLLEAGTLRKDGTVVSIAMAGAHGGATVDPDNIDATGAGLLGRLRNAAASLDCFTKEFTVRYPSLRAIHVFPGLVRTSAASNSKSSYFLQVVFGIIFSIPYLSWSPKDYAPVALWIAASDEAKSMTDTLAYGATGEVIKLGPAAEDDGLRGKIWDKAVALARANT